MSKIENGDLILNEESDKVGLRFSVRDNGIGMHQAFIPHLSKPIDPQLLHQALVKYIGKTAAET